MARALIVVDFQRDFTPGGALGVTDGDAIADRVNDLAANGRFDLVIATRDWHPADHRSFTAQGGTWPVHCVAGTPGAQLDPAFASSRVDVLLDKGTSSKTDGYSGFDGTGLAATLRGRGIKELVIVGLATDYCVKHTALDALKEGFAVTVDPAACRPVELEAGDGGRALDEIRAAGGTVL